MYKLYPQYEKQRQERKLNVDKVGEEVGSK